MAQEKEHILMVGNSFTFYYNLPMTLELMAQDKGLQWVVHQSTAGGATLKQHWLGEKKLKTKKRLRQKKFDRIIFQEHSRYPLIAIDTTQKYLKKMVDFSFKKAKKYVYATWSYPKILVDQRLNVSSLEIEEVYASFTFFSGTILPVGRAFDLFRDTYPQQRLFTSDNKHPNPVGSYLAACVIFSQLSGLSSQGLPRRKAKELQRGKKIYYFIVEKEVALQCQKIADKVVFGR